MEEKFKCLICGNQDPKYFGHRNGKIYCRKCISFKGETVLNRDHYPKVSPITISYSLSNEQISISNKLVSNYQNGINSLVNAVCGAGKTEIVLKVISYALQCGDKVGFTIPRRDVAIELFERFKNFFRSNKVVAVYGGHHEELDGDLIILTTHQLYRYNNFFDLLIIDEIDAFPYQNNEVLNTFFYKSLRGNYIMMSATPSEEILKEFNQDGFEILSLNNRFHGYPLPHPEVFVAYKPLLNFLLIRFLFLFKRQKKQVFIFCPTIEMCESVYSFLRPIFKNGNFVHSKRKNRSEIINSFRNKKIMFLVTTAVLERGVTVSDLQVIVYLANHHIYDYHSLIQISGRVGRKMNAPEGRVIFLSEEDTDDIKKCVEQIEIANKDLQGMF